MSKRFRTLQLFDAQNGLCWICGLPMKRPRKDRRPGTAPGRFEATVDHLAERGTTFYGPRPVKAAHAKCNSVRHHYPVDHPLVQQHIAEMRALFARLPNPLA